MLRRVWLAVWPLLCAAGVEDSALDRYVRAADPSYRWEKVKTLDGPGLKVHVLEMVSQRWLTEAEVDRPEWRHWLMVYVPEGVERRTALLVIDGGSASATAPSSAEMLLTLLALESRSVVVQLKNVPNQPLRFAGSEKARSEDALIAWTWAKYLETGEERWPARLPMTKAAVRAMDAVTEFMPAVQRFVVAGGSKRGWATWTTAAVDRRVVAIVPMVIDALNVEASFRHHYRAYGFWAPAIGDYVEMGLMGWLGTPEWRRLMEIEDPWEYRERIAIPKMLVHSTGDQFFLPDSSQFYFDSLAGEKYLRYVPNTDHALNTLELPPDLLAFYTSFLDCVPRPRFSWKADRAAGTIRLKALDEPEQVLLWEAENAEARDFRLATIGPAWRSTPVGGENGVYVAAPARPEKGYKAFFLEMTWKGERYPFRFTTEVVVTPDVYPFEAPAAGAASGPGRR